MSWIAKAVLAAAWLNCGLANVWAQTPDLSKQQSGSWLKDGDCALFSAGAAAGDRVSWTGACIDGFAEGMGTATFTHDGQSQSFTAVFRRGVIPDGHIITRWGQGWSYDGETVGGRFNGAGILTTDNADRFEGVWTDGQMNGFGILRRSNGDRYAGDWKNDRPNGSGELRRADGTLLRGNFVDGRLEGAAAGLKTASTESGGEAEKKTARGADASSAPFGSVSGKTLVGVDGSSIALTVIEGGMELQVVPMDGNARKTTFTFMTERMGTVVEDGASPSAGSSVTGFFRLTGKGVEIRYADGRSAMLSSSPEGGVQMALEADSGPSCHAWYPPGHNFSDVEKKMALNAYASKLGLPVTGMGGDGCAPESQAANVPPANSAPANPAPGNPALVNPAPSSPPAVAKAKPERKSQLKMPARAAILRDAPARVAKASYRIGDYRPADGPNAGLESVAVKPSEIHTIDSAIAVPPTGSAMAMAPPTAPSSGDRDASRCLQVDSDGHSWGFRNSCDFAVQFAYCMADSDNSLASCGGSGVVTTSVAGSVAAKGFGALASDTSLKDRDGSYKFRWVSCAGGAGEVVARLDRSDPPSGRCERPRSASK